MRVVHCKREHSTKYIGHDSIYGNRADALVKDDYEEAFELASTMMEMRKIPIEIKESAA